MTNIPTLPSDHQLVGAVRDDLDAAWAELMGRHESSIRSVRRAGGSRRKMRDVSGRLAALRESIADEMDPLEGDVALRAFRPRAIAACTGGMYGPHPPSHDDRGHHHRSHHDRGDGDLVALSDDELLAIAFARLPEPWQTVLWHTHVENLTAAEVSPLVGRTANDVAELRTTAERGLVDAFFVEYLSVGPLSTDATEVVSLLSGYVRRALPPRDLQRVESHLDGEQTSFSVAPTQPTIDALASAIDAEGASVLPPPTARVHSRADSRRLVAIASSLNEYLPASIAPGITGLSVEEHRRALGVADRARGTSTLLASRSDRVRRLALFTSVAVIVIALAGAAYLVRRPFANDLVSTGPAPTAPLVTNPVSSVADDGVATVDEPVDTQASPDPVVEVPPTTDFDLRPTPSGPVNAIRLEFEGAGESTANTVAGLRQAPNGLTVSVSAPAPAYAGGTATVDVSITNSTSAVIDDTMRLELTKGVVLDAVVDDAGADCTDPDDGWPFCVLRVEAGSTSTLVFRFALESSSVGRLTVDGDLVVDPLEEQIVVTRNLVHTSVGRGGVVMIGNSLMTCDDDAAAAIDIDCDRVREGRGDVVNRWDVPMEFIGAAPAFGLENGSAATLELADGATVAAAYLYWSGDLEERGQKIPEGALGEVTMATPGGDTVTIEADRVILGDVDATQYLGSADVTDLVAASGSGDYVVGNVRSIEVQGSYAAWSLVVVFDDDVAPRRLRMVTQPFHWIAPEPVFEYLVDLPVPVVRAGAMSLDVLAFEGERGFIPETLSVGGADIGGENPFDSTLVGSRAPMYDNNLGVDIDVYDLTIDTPTGTLPIAVTSAKDGVRIAVLALSVDLAG